MTDNRIKDRVKVMLNAATSPDITTADPPLLAPDPGQALQVLTLAQRTADEHINSAHRHAGKIRAEAEATAERIARDAQQHADNVRREADTALAEARAATEQAAREAQARVQEAQRTADTIVSEARARAEAIAADAERGAEALKVLAQRRYDDVVGGLGVKREALQQQIESLERFDGEYRARLTAFMQGQLRALWVDRPEVAGEPGPLPDPPGGSPAPGRRESEGTNGSVPAQRRNPEPAIKPASGKSAG